MGKICINQLTVSAVIGDLPEERLRRQPLFIDLVLETDMRQAAESDKLADTVDYAAVEKITQEIAEKSSFAMLEALLGAIGSAVSALPGVIQCLVRIEKPGALRVARTIALEASFEKGRMLP